MESSLHILKTSLCSRYLKLTEDEEKYISGMTPEVSHGQSIWLANYRKKQAEQGSVEGLNDVYTDRYTSDEDDILTASRTLYCIGLRALAETVARYVPDKQAKIIDIGAGRGNLGLKLKQVGFTTLDALEPAEGVVNVIPKDLYGTIYKEPIFVDTPTSIPSDKYDYILASGAIIPGHIEVEAFPELFRVIKPGGGIIFNIPDYWLKYKDHGARLEAMLQLRLEDGTLESVIKERAVYIYDKEDCNQYIVKKSSKK